MRAMQRNAAGRIMIECPTTIFHLYVHNEDEVSKVEIFMRNTRHIKNLGLIDIYKWCNRQGIAYDTSFNYQKKYSVWKNIKSYIRYSSQKHKYQLQLEAV